MSESTLTSTITDIQRVATLEMGWGRGTSADPIAQWSSANEIDFTMACKEGYRKFLYPDPLPGENKSHNWSFLYPQTTLRMVTGYSDSTSTMSLDDATAVTPDGLGLAEIKSGTAVFPSWATQGTLIHKSLGYPILATNTTETEAYVEAVPAGTSIAATSDWAIERTYYDLPDDFGGMMSDSFTYSRREQWHLPDIRIVGEQEIRKIDRAFNGEIYPRVASITPKPIQAITESSSIITQVSSGSPVAGLNPEAPGSTRWQVRFYPLSEQSYEIEYRYHAIPPALNEATDIYHYGGAEHSQTVIAAVIDALYRRLHSSNEKSAEFQNRLRQSVLHDRRNHSSGYLGTGWKSEPGLSGSAALREFRSSIATGNITTTFN